VIANFEPRLRAGVKIHLEAAPSTRMASTVIVGQATITL